MTYARKYTSKRVARTTSCHIIAVLHNGLIYICMSLHVHGHKWVTFHAPKAILGISQNHVSLRFLIVKKPSTPNLYDICNITWNHSKICRFFTQNHERQGKLLFTKFSFHKNGETWNFFRTQFTQILIMTHDLCQCMILTFWLVMK